MNQAQLDALIAAGLAQGAQRLGSSYSIFRPVGPIDPLATTPVGALLAVFDPSPTLTLTQSDDRGGNTASMIGDYTLVQAGDYLVGTDTWFVSHIEPLRAAICVRCNQSVSIIASLSAPSTGSASYGGRTPATDTVLASGWPASLLTKGRPVVPSARLPGDTRSVGAEVMLPTIPGLAISVGQLLLDGFGQLYAVSSSETSERGWRLQVGLVMT